MVKVIHFAVLSSTSQALNTTWCLAPSSEQPCKVTCFENERARSYSTATGHTAWIGPLVIPMALLIQDEDANLLANPLILFVCCVNTPFFFCMRPVWTDPHPDIWFQVMQCYFLKILLFCFAALHMRSKILSWHCSFLLWPQLCTCVPVQVWDESEEMRLTQWMKAGMTGCGERDLLLDFTFLDKMANQRNSMNYQTAVPPASALQCHHCFQWCWRGERRVMEKSKHGWLMRTICRVGWVLTHLASSHSGHGSTF